MVLGWPDIHMYKNDVEAPTSYHVQNVLKMASKLKLVVPQTIPWRKWLDKVTEWEKNFADHIPAKGFISRIHFKNS